MARAFSIAAVWVGFNVSKDPLALVLTASNRDLGELSDMDDAKIQFDAQVEAEEDAEDYEQNADDYADPKEAPENWRIYTDRQQMRLKHHVAISVSRAGGWQPEAINRTKRSVVPFRLLPDLSRRNYWKLQYTKGTTWIFGTYHKTGCELVVNMLAKLKRRTTDDINFVGDAIIEDHRKVFWPGKWDNFFFEPRLGVISLLPKYRMVHFTRNPVHVVISAYRFHSTCPDGEPWLLERMSTSIFNTSWLIDGLKGHSRRDLAVKFKYALYQNHSLCDFYRDPKMRPEDAVIIEAYRSQHELERMSKNYVNTAMDPNVLQVSLESVMADFDGTMRCVFSFLGETRKLRHPPKLLKKISDLKTPHDAAHVTSGKYDNSKLIRRVWRIPHVFEAHGKMKDAGPGVRSCSVK